MRKPLFLLLLLLPVFFGLSCSKHYDHAVSGPGTVYIAGDDGVNPILWVNGRPQKLEGNGGFGAQVLLSGYDVYVAGVSNEGTTTVPTPAGPSGQYCYWKNGAETPIGNPKFVESPEAIAVDGSEIYFSSGPLYENGSQVPLQGLGQSGGGFVCAAMTVGSDVYLAGRDSTGNGVYWKNGVMHPVAATQPLGSGIQIYCMYVTNGNVYIGGTDLQRKGAIWINGVETNVQSSGGEPLFNVKAIFVDGPDVYSISNFVVNDGNAPAYWKNGQQVNLPLNGAAYGNATCIFVSGGDVYVTGVTSHGAVLWKNGVETVLSPAGDAYSVVVK